MTRFVTRWAWLIVFLSAYPMTDVFYQYLSEFVELIEAPNAESNFMVVRYDGTQH